uniref:Uncharacterized protein n=1 Tax=Oryza rufipogon TaxID=4529 RepID=A0A0E0PMY5_ORYRU
MTPTAENSMPPSLKPRRQASMSAPRPSAGAATVCCGWYPSITVRRSSRSAITVVPWCAHGQHTNCLMKCMIESYTSSSWMPLVYRYLWIERVTGSSFEVGLDDLKLSEEDSSRIASLEPAKHFYILDFKDWFRRHTNSI